MSEKDPDQQSKPRAKNPAPIFSDVPPDPFAGLPPAEKGFHWEIVNDDIREVPDASL